MAQLEANLTSISEALQEMRDLLKSSIRNEERIRVLQEENKDQEKRIRLLETARDKAKWIDRAVWAMVAAGLSLLWKIKE